MHRLIAVFLLGGICSVTFGSQVTVWAWQLRRDWIAANRCENRFQPQLQCGGKCILMQKLKQADAEAPASGQPPVVQKLVEFLAPQARLPLPAPLRPVIMFSIERAPAVHPGHSGAVWHPPSAA